jgi:hypothetical protein
MTSLVEPVSARKVPAQTVGAHDRLFYGTMAVSLAITTFAGFSRTYYLKLVSGGPMATLTGGPFTRLIQVHGALFTAWVLLFIVQTALISTRRVAVHRRLGIAGAVLAAAMVVAGGLVAIATAARGSAPPGMTPLSFLVIPLFDLLLFAGFLSAALVARRNKETHKRLMLLAYVNIVTAAIARLPGILPLGPPAFFGLALLFVVAGAIYDFVSRGRVHKSYIWGAAIIVVSIPLRLGLANTSAWQSFARLLTA